MVAAAVAVVVSTAMLAIFLNRFLATFSAKSLVAAGNNSALAQRGVLICAMTIASL